jgi:hypothetical protein
MTQWPTITFRGIGPSPDEHPRSNDHVRRTCPGVISCGANRFDPVDHCDERLTLLDVMKARRLSAELAFLSACDSAAVDVENLPDEVIHLTAALQFCMLWAMVDKDGPDVPEDFYYLSRGTNREWQSTAAVLLCQIQQGVCVSPLS